ncbi:MAG: PP2C family protein-serine/threonine phosphatase [Ktedonobacteraceae bacterium]
MPNNRDGNWRISHDWEEDIRPLPTTKPTALTYVVGARSDPGKQKKRNEDSIFVANNTWSTSLSSCAFGLFVLADGMGAYANGQEASRWAIQTIVDYIWPKLISNPLQPEACSTLLAEAVKFANEAVQQQNIHLHNRAETDADVGVLTTVTTAMTLGSTAYIANVGNSRTYLYRASEGLKQITTDHSVVARLVQDGNLTPEDVYTHLQRRQLYRALFDQPFVEVDLFTLPLHLGDTLLLCSYGLWSMVRDPQIADILNHTFANPSKAAETLMQAALDGGGKDNVSVIVISLGESEN